MRIKNKIMVVMLSSIFITTMLVSALQLYSVYQSAGQDSTLNLKMLEGLCFGI